MQGLWSGSLRPCAMCNVLTEQLCDTHRQPHPPSTAEHYAALQTFVVAGAQYAIEECCGELNSVLGQPQRRAAHLVGYMHRQAWPQPSQACLSLQKAHREAACSSSKALALAALGADEPIAAGTLA